MPIPFVDLKSQYKALREEMDAAIQNVVDNTAFVGGPFVEKFEKEFAEFCQTRYAIGVASGPDALWMALLALGIGRDDEVITVPNTYFATTEAISLTGAKPVFVDVDEQTQNMNPALIAAAITPKTKAIIPVHLFGQMADMDPIMAIAKEHNLYVIEDACQAHGATYKGKRAGSIGDIGCFSFYPGKNLGAYGEGGAITTNDEKLMQFIGKFRDHGQDSKYYHSMVGTNGRLHGIQGAVLSVKLKYLEEWNAARRKNAALYTELLSNMKGVTLLHQAEYGEPVYHLYPIRIKQRDRILEALAAKEIYCGIHYPIPIHLQNAYQSLSLAKGTFPVSERCAEELLSLPMFPELTEDQIRNVVDELANLLRSEASASNETEAIAA